MDSRQITISETGLHELNSYIEGLVAEDKFSGSVLVASHGEVLYKKAFGMANKGYGIPNATETKFNLGSINKMFTAVSIMKLAENGLIDLNDVIGKYLSNLPKEYANKITIHQLLTHTSGTGLYWNENSRLSLHNLKQLMIISLSLSMIRYYLNQEQSAHIATQDTYF